MIIIILLVILYHRSKILIYNDNLALFNLNESSEYRKLFSFQASLMLHQLKPMSLEDQKRGELCGSKLLKKGLKMPFYELFYVPRFVRYFRVGTSRVMVLACFFIIVKVGAMNLSLYLLQALTRNGCDKP